MPEQPPEDRKQQRPLYNFKASAELHAAADKAAKKEGITKSEWTRRQLEDASGLSGNLVLRAVITDPVLARMIEAAVESQGTTVRAFTRECVEAEARREMKRLEREPFNPNRPVQNGQCKHPLPARKQIVNRVICRACGEVVRYLQ